MRFLRREKRIEERVQEYIDELAEEFNLPIPFYPEVYWVGKNGRSFKELGLPSYMLDDFKSIRKNHSSLTASNPKVILIGAETQIDLTEESAHFVYDVSNSTKLKNLNNHDILYLEAINEMFGFFGSKLLFLARKNHFSDRKDFLSLTQKERKNSL